MSRKQNDQVGQESANSNVSLSFIEIVTVVAVVGIFSSVAIPTYQNHLYRKRAVSVVEAVDKIQAALTELQATTGAQMGKSLLVSTNIKGIQPVTWQLKGQEEYTQGLDTISKQDLRLKKLGLQLEVLSGFGSSDTDGAFTVRIYWSEGDLKTKGQQTALATLVLLRSRALKTTVGDTFAAVEMPLTTDEMTQIPAEPQHVAVLPDQ